MSEENWIPTITVPHKCSQTEESDWVPELDEIFNNMDDIKNILGRMEQKLDSKKCGKIPQKKNIVYYKGNNEKVSIHRKNSGSND